MAIADLQAGVPRHRIATAVDNTALATGMVIKAMNVDALPMLYSSTIGLKMPLDYNTLSPLEIFQSKECTKFSESLRTTAVYMANSVCVVERLKIPTILSMSLSRTQLYEWQDAINAAHFIRAHNC